MGQALLSVVTPLEIWLQCGDFQLDQPNLSWTVFNSLYIYNADFVI